MWRGGSSYFPGDSQEHFLSESYTLVNSFPKMEIPVLRDGAHRPLGSSLVFLFLSGKSECPGEDEKFTRSSVKHWELRKLESGQNIWEFKRKKKVKLFIRPHKFSQEQIL